MTQRDINHTYQVSYYIQLFTIFTRKSDIVNVPHLLSEYRQGTSTVAKSGGGGISGAISQIRENTQFYDKHINNMINNI